jgi:hypothetical protein
MSHLHPFIWLFPPISFVTGIMIGLVFFDLRPFLDGNRSDSALWIYQIVIAVCLSVIGILLVISWRILRATDKVHLAENAQATIKQLKSKLVAAMLNDLNEPGVKHWTAQWEFDETCLHLREAIRKATLDDHCKEHLRWGFRKYEEARVKLIKEDHVICKESEAIASDTK